MRNEHLLTVPAGDNVVRLLPPLIVTVEDIREALEDRGRARNAVPKSSLTKRTPHP
jgi:acetylornithine/N-succinyldiaminopimelate aminotransferase